MSILYAIERRPLGWLLCGAPGEARIPLDCAGECFRFFPEGCLLERGIAHHFRETGKVEVVECIATAGDGAKWREEITARLAGLPAQERWWKGVDVGQSSAALFAVFCDKRWHARAHSLGGQATPADADDFGRCRRLLELFPDWRASLSKVADAYPGTAWASVVAQWDNLERSDPGAQTQLLAAL